MPNSHSGHSTNQPRSSEYDRRPFSKPEPPRPRALRSSRAKKKNLPRSPPRQSPPRKRDSPLKRKRSPPPRSTPGKPGVLAGVAPVPLPDKPSSAAHSLLQQQVNYWETRSRYPRMALPKDYSSTQILWTEHPEQMKLTEWSIDFEFASQAVGNDCTPASVPSTSGRPAQESLGDDGKYYTVKVLISSGMRAASDQPKGQPLQHHFVVGKNDGEVFCIGGASHRELDGGNPADPNVWEATAARHLKNFTGWDLAALPRPCRWLSFLSIEYQRQAGMEVCVILIPCIWEVPLAHLIVVSAPEPESSSHSHSQPDEVPAVTSLSTEMPENGETVSLEVVDMEISDDDAPASPIPAQTAEVPLAKAEPVVAIPPIPVVSAGKETEPEPEVIRLVTPVAHKGVKLRARSLALVGMLEYDKKDVGEHTFEASLCGELFSDLLRLQNGKLIRTALERYRSNRAQLLISDEPALKRQKLGDSSEENSEEVRKLHLKAAFEYFDEKRIGYFWPEQLEDILYRLGDSSSARIVEELVDPLIAASTGRIPYSDLLESGAL